MGQAVTLSQGKHSWIPRIYLSRLLMPASTSANNDAPLLCVSTVTAPHFEEPVATLLENLTGQSPIVYEDAETHATTISVYLEPEQWNRSNRATLKRVLDEIGAEGARVAIRRIQPRNWAESWKKHFKPIEIGRALLVKPSWSRRRPRKGQALVVLDPGLSFGTGRHATTFFCLEQLVARRQPDVRQSFLDVGSGSGILAIAAAKLGYRPVRAFDFDPEAVRVSRANAAMNSVPVRPVRRDLAKMPGKPPHDVICANLTYDLLVAHGRKLVNRLKQGGWMIVAGILETQFPQVQETFERLGLNLVEARTLNEWRSGVFTAA
jgi:ribosomal protein L11 methyltransferase